MNRNSRTQKTSAAVFWLAIAAVAGCSPATLHLNRNSPPFGEVVSNLLREPSSSSPTVGASFRLSHEGDSVRYALARERLALLESVDTSSLSVGERIDWRVLRAHQRKVLTDSSLMIPRKLVSRYLVLGSLSWDVGDGVGIESGRWRRVLRTLIDAPDAMAIGRGRLVLPPPLWVGLAARTAELHEKYLSGEFLRRVDNVGEPRLADSLRSAAHACAAALSSFRVFLTDTLRYGAESSWAVGEDYYTWLLREYHFLPYGSSELIEQGMRIHAETKRELAALADRIRPGAQWRDLVEEMKTHHPAPFDILRAYAGESARARDLLENRSMIHIPPAETLVFVPTPPGLRETYAWGGYGGIEMRDSTMTGRFFVTDVVPGMTEAETEQKLKTQNTGWMTVIALHEGYPGHHLQSVYARLHPNAVRARFGSTYFGEGWALYCESWMGRNGFYVDAWDSLGWLNMRLWRTARVIVDPSIHTGRMSYEQAVAFMMDEVGLERSAAEAEINRYTTWPAQAPSYIIGWLELERLKSAATAGVAPGLSDRAFAEAVLSCGSLPPALLREALLDSIARGEFRTIRQGD